tara:strand:+ start:454 stop:918 length:465 start_codon:yes stop_codon:yes gene_type:complete
MKNLFIFVLIILIFSACSLKNVEKRHGVHFLDKKQEKLTINRTNKNDIISLLGSPSTKSTFDNSVWIYIESIVSHTSLNTFGKEKIIVNNVLLLEFNSKGLLSKKDFFDLNDMKDIKYVERITGSKYQKNTFIYSFLSSMRQKINDPLGKRKKR